MPPERVISISLSESDWKALRTIQPEPIDWLKGKIRETIEQARQASASDSTTQPAVAAAGAGQAASAHKAH